MITLIGKEVKRQSPLEKGGGRRGITRQVKGEGGGRLKSWSSSDRRPKTIGKSCARWNCNPEVLCCFLRVGVFTDAEEVTTEEMQGLAWEEMDLALPHFPRPEFQVAPR